MKNGERYKQVVYKRNTKIYNAYKEMKKVTSYQSN